MVAALGVFLINSESANCVTLKQLNVKMLLVVTHSQQDNCSVQL